MNNDFEENQPSTSKRRILSTENKIKIKRLTWEQVKDVAARKLPVTGQMLHERI